MAYKQLLGMLAAYALAPVHAGAQTTTNMAGLKGLAPVTILSRTAADRAALAGNYSVTG